MPNKTTNIHPLRKHLLETRLKQIEYLERQQARQDHFTTQLYGKRNYNEEKEDILYELRNSSNKKIPYHISSITDSFIPAEPDEPSDFDRRKTLWEINNNGNSLWKNKQKTLVFKNLLKSKTSLNA